MKISVCMPVMGRGEMLTQALYSILMQGYPDVELVLKDGDPEHPVADHPSVSAALRCFPSQPKYEVGKDGGVFPALNNCLKRATGDILYFMCSDDLLCAGAFQAAEQAFSSDRFGGPLWIYGKTVSADETGATLGIDGDLTTFEALSQKNCIGQPSVFWNRQMYHLVGAFDPRYPFAADYDMWLRFWRKREPIFLNQTLGIFRHHAGSDTQMHPVETDAVAQKISIRQRFLGTEIERARNALQAKRLYDGEEMPLAHDYEPRD